MCAVSAYEVIRFILQYIVPVGVGLNKSQPYAETSFSLPSFSQCQPLIFCPRNISADGSTYVADIGGVLTASGTPSVELEHFKLEFQLE